MKRATLLLMLAAWTVPAVVLAEGESAPTTSPAASAPDTFVAPFMEAFDSGQPRFAEADAVLNEARLAASNSDAARHEIDRLQAVLAKYPDYPHRPMVHYFLGVNYHILQQYDKSAPMLDEALRARPDLAATTSVTSYLDKARWEILLSRISWAMIVALAVVLLAAIVGLTWRGRDVRWVRLTILFGGVLALWVAGVILLPMLLGQTKEGLDIYSKPVLVNFRFGQMGDGLLWGLLLYGAGAILASMVVVAAASRLRRPAATMLGLGGTLIVTLALMGLFGIRYCANHSRYEDGRLFFMVKDIGTMKDVPDEMLPLYEQSYRERVIKARAEPN